MFKGIKSLLVYKDYSNIDLKAVHTQIMEENRKFAIIWASVQSFYWIYCLIMSTTAWDYRMCQYIYLAAFLTCVLSLILAIFAAPKVTWLIRPISIAVDMALLGAGIFIARHLAPKTIVIFASVIIVPVLFICSTLSTLILLLINAAMFTLIGMPHMEPQTFRWTLTNMLIFSSIGIILGYFVNKARFERYFFAEAAVQLAESNAKLAELQRNYAYYDQMTGLLNRRAYAEKIDQFIDNKPSDSYVVIADINGLKEMNDRCGHDAGDELIIGFAECLRNTFYDTDAIYRIGGDEFCVILENTTDPIEECLKQLDEAGRHWKGKVVNGISISYGCASDKEFDSFDAMLKAADQRMYQFKSNYYMVTGKKKNH